MRWPNLTKNNCPKCNKPLGFNTNDEMLFCNDLNCGFQISQYRFETLCTQMNERAKTGIHPRDNFAELQRMGTEEQTQEEADNEMLDRIGI